jgi:PAS domain S-box-containing protein
MPEKQRGSRKGTKSRTRGRKLRLTEAKTRVGRARKSRADLEQEVKAYRRKISKAHKRLAEAAMQQTATSEMLRLISNSPIQSVLDVVAEQAARLCDASNAQIWRLDDNVLRLAASYGESPATMDGREGLPADRDTVTGRAACDRRTIHVHDISAEVNEFPAGSRLVRGQGWRTTLATPLLRKGVPIGTILVGRTEIRPFHVQQIALLEAFADQAAIAIENVRLFNELQEREARIRRLVDSNIIGIFIGDSRGRIIEANDAFLEMLGYGHDDVTSGRMRWTKLTPTEWVPADEDALAQLSLTGTCRPYEKEYCRKDGSRVPVLVGGAFFERKADEGVVFVIDMRDRKHAEEALRESERSARSALDGIGGLVAIMTPNGEVETVNRQCVEYFGRPVEEQRDWVTTDMVHPEDLPQMLENFKRAIASEIAYHFEQRLRRFDGEYRWFETRGGAVRDDTGSIVRWYVLLTDIEDRKRAEDRLRRSEAYLAEAQRLSHSGVSAYTETAILYGSEETYRIWGFDSAQGVPSLEAVIQRIHPDDRGRMLAQVRSAVSEKRDYSIAYRIVLPDGTTKQLEVIGRPAFSATGELVEIVTTQIDVTERKRAEEALRAVEAEARESEQRYREAQLELEHANRVATMGQLTASITHEVNQPITAAVTYALAARRWLNAQPPNFHEADDALSLIVKEGNRAGEVVGRIRALIKKAPARKDAVAINDAVLEVIALTRTEGTNKRVSVRTQLAEGLPSVLGDRVQLQQVLLNLILNAIEAMRDTGEKKRELLICSRNDPEGVAVEVRDSGPGFAPEDIDRVFEAFYTTKPGGLGLGLSICRSIIESHNGRIWASPNVPRGAVFGFTAPAHPAAGS